MPQNGPVLNCAPQVPAQVVTVHVLDGHPLEMRKGSVQRDWMDALPQRYGYRCLPLNIANSFGWDILCPSRIQVRKVEQRGREVLELRHQNPKAPAATSHFGSGILTFHVPALFKTTQGTALHVSGPANHIKPGAHPLTGIVETDWLNFTFTMNWLITARDTWITFEQGEPVCTVFPVDLDAMENTQVEICSLSDTPALAEVYAQHSQSRETFNAALKAREPEAQKQGWQRDYFQGQDAPNHRTKLTLNTPNDQRQPSSPPAR